MVKRKRQISLNEFQLVEELYYEIWFKHQFCKLEYIYEEYQARYKKKSRPRSTFSLINIENAVWVSQLLLREYFRVFFAFTFSKKDFKNDVKLIWSHWITNRTNIFVKVIDTLAIIAEVFLHCECREDFNLKLHKAPLWFLDWFEEYLASNFYKSGGWKALDNIACEYYDKTFNILTEQLCKTNFGKLKYKDSVYNEMLVIHLQTSPVLFPAPDTFFRCLDERFHKKIAYIRSKGEIEAAKYIEDVLEERQSVKAKTIGGINTKSVDKKSSIHEELSLGEEILLKSTKSQGNQTDENIDSKGEIHLHIPEEIVSSWSYILSPFLELEKSKIQYYCPISFYFEQLGKKIDPSISTPIAVFMKLFKQFVTKLESEIPSRLHQTANSFCHESFLDDSNYDYICLDEADITYLNQALYKFLEMQHKEFNPQICYNPKKEISMDIMPYIASDWLNELKKECGFKKTPSSLNAEHFQNISRKQNIIYRCLSSETIKKIEEGLLSEKFQITDKSIPSVSSLHQVKEISEESQSEFTSLWKQFESKLEYKVSHNIKNVKLFPLDANLDTTIPKNVNIKSSDKYYSNVQQEIKADNEMKGARYLKEDIKNKLFHKYNTVQIISRYYSNSLEKLFKNMNQDSIESIYVETYTSKGCSKDSNIFNVKVLSDLKNNFTLLLCEYNCYFVGRENKSLNYKI